MFLSVLINTESFETDKYGEQSIRREAKFITYHSAPKAPSQNFHLINREVLNDQTSLLQIGDS